MSEPIICARQGCHHRLRMHDQGVDGAQGCLVPNCACYDFLDPNLNLYRSVMAIDDTNRIWSKRHPSVAHFEPLFAYGHLPEHLQAVSGPFGELALELLEVLKDGPELSAALRKLVEAKDCAVRQAVIDRG